MVSGHAEVNCLSRCPLVSFGSRVVIFVFSILVSLTNSHDSCLRSQNSWHEIPSTDIADTRDTESAVSEVVSGQKSVIGFVAKSDKFIINLEDALLLHLLDVGYGQTIFRVNGNAEVVVVFHHIPLDIPV